MGKRRRRKMSDIASARSNLVKRQWEEGEAVR